jgi:peptidyl-prolyl cis-trans isomerase D
LYIRRLKKECPDAHYPLIETPFSMATLQKIRNKAVLLTVIIGLALFAFIIGDFLNSGSSLMRQSKETIAEIGDYSLDYKEYEARIQEMQDVYAIQTGEDNLDDETIGKLRESVFQSIVREKLIQQQADLLGVTVTGKELFSMMNGANIHPLIMQLPIFRNQQTGQFDRSVMLNFLQTIEQEDLSNYEPEAQEQISKLKTYWLFWENNLRYSRLEEKINALLLRAVRANNLDAQTDFENAIDQVDFAYVMKPYSLLSDTLFTVSMGDIKKRYAEKKKQFYQEPYRAASYVLVNIAASQEDFSAVETKINSLKETFVTTEDPLSFAMSNSDDVVYDCNIANSLYDEDVKSFLASGDNFMEPVYKEGLYRMAKVLGRSVAPDSVKARQIVLPIDDMKRADSIVAALRGGADFEAMVTKYNSGNTSDMGWFREIDAKEMGDVFLKACFSATKNTYFTVKTKYDVRVMQVTDMTKPVNKSRLALISLKVTPSSTTYSNMYNDLNKIVAEHQHADDFFKAAQKAGYTVQEAPIVKAVDNTLGGIPQMRQAVRFVFTNGIGKLSGILENNNNQFVVVGVTGINDDEYQSLESVKPQLMKELISEKKGEKFLKEMESKDYKTLEQFATAEKLAIDTIKFYDFSIPTMTGLGNEPALMAASVKAELNKVVGPIKGKNGLFMLQVVAKRKAVDRYDLEYIRQSWNYNTMYRINNEGFEPIKKALKVEDNRISIY